METEDRGNPPREECPERVPDGSQGAAGSIDSTTDPASGAESTARPDETDGSGGLGGWKKIALIALIGLVVLTLTCSAYLAATWPDVEGLRTENPETTAFIERYEEREREAGREPQLRWRWVPYDQISPHLMRAVVVAEDIEFFSHEGFSVSEIRAVIDRFLSGEGELRGASTITQQLAKNLWLSPSRNPLRKLKEALLTRQLEEHLSKRRILEVYLNVVEFGPGVYGAGAAARGYFAKPASALDELESAQLAASLPRPSVWHPGVDSDRYWWYMNEILGRMEEAEFLWRRIGTDVQLPPDERPAEEVTPLGTDTAGGDTILPKTPLSDTIRSDTTAIDSIPADTSPPGPTPLDTAAADAAGAETGRRAGGAARRRTERRAQNGERRVSLDPRAAAIIQQGRARLPNVQFFSCSLTIQPFVPSGSATFPTTDRSLFLRMTRKVTSSSAS